MSKLKNISGKKFGRLTVIKRADNIKPGRPRWYCLCSCGNTTIVSSDSLLKKDTKSCGCLLKESTGKRFTSHKLSKHPLYGTWQVIKSRCYNKNRKDFKYYGGKGVTICDKWKNSFPAFLADVGERPFPKAELDRIDPNGNYCPENVQWVSHKKNMQNLSLHSAKNYNKPVLSH